MMLGGVRLYSYERTSTSDLIVGIDVGIDVDFECRAHPNNNLNNNLNNCS
jgi:hypothetical protein